MPRQNPHSPISLSQVAASALAASAAAFAASYLGVAGTIVGAAVASVIVTVASAMFHSSFLRSGDVVRRTTGRVVRPAPSAESPQPYRRPPSWRRTVVAAAAVLGITLAGLTGLETALGKPLSALLDGSETSGTSLGSAVQGPSHHAQPASTRADPAGGSTTTPSTPTPTLSSDPTEGTGTEPPAPTTPPVPDPTSAPTPTAPPADDPSSSPTGVPTDPPITP